MPFNTLIFTPFSYAMIEAIITGFTLGIILSISIGPIIFAIIQQSLSNGIKGGMFFVAGVSASDILLVTVCNLLSALIEKAIQHQQAIALVGSIFLMAIGIYTLFFKKLEITQDGFVAIKTFKKKDLLRIFSGGFLMNILNPGVFIFWLAATTKVKAQVVEEKYPIRYLITVYAICLLFVLATDVAKVFLAGKIRPKLTPHNLNIINKISGIILLIFGVSLFFGSKHLALGH
jgi:threonine/homoserine/homoserine lactone efflux protein